MKPQNLRFHLINNSGYCVWHIITTHSHLSLGNEFFFLYKLLYNFQENWFPIVYFHASNNTCCQYSDFVLTFRLVWHKVLVLVTVFHSIKFNLEFHLILLKCIQNYSVLISTFKSILSMTDADTWIAHVVITIIFQNLRLYK